MNHLYDLIKTMFAEPFTTERCLARRMAVSKGTVHRYRRLIRSRGYSWDALRGLKLSDLDALFNKRQRQHGKAAPDFAVIDEELKNPIVTLYQLWKEYRRRVKSSGYSYSRYAYLYRKFRGARQPEMRQTYRPGGVLYVDFSGEKPTYIDQATGHRVQAELFVGVLAASNYTYACVTRTQSVVDVIDAHCRMFEYFGGAAEALTPDNMKAAVEITRHQGLKIQADFMAMSEHYGVATLPTRPYKPRDKGKVEGAVLIAQREILAPDRHVIFPSFAALEAAIAERLEELNARPHSNAPDSRRDRFLQSDATALRPLPQSRFTYSTLRPKAKVPKNYHIKVDGHFYSVPHRFIGEEVQARVEPSEIIFLAKREEVARHARSVVSGGTTTDVTHQSGNHAAQAQRNRAGFLAWAKGVGPNTVAIVEAQFDRQFPL